MHNKKNKSALDYVTFLPNNQSKQNQTKDLNKNNKRISKMPFVTFPIFALLAFLCLMHHADYLYMVQERSLFINDATFWHERMAYIGGFSQWLGCFFTQFFYYPWLGVCILILFWTAIAFFLTKTYKLNGLWATATLVVPAALLLSEIDLGYWLYCLKMPGYWFTQTISVLFMTLIMRLSSSLKGWWKVGGIVLTTTIAYPLIGSWALAAALWSGINTINDKKDKRKLAVILCASLITIVSVPLLYYVLGYVHQRFEELWIINFPVFRETNLTSLLPSIPFIITVCWPAVLLAIQKYSENQLQISKHVWMQQAIAYVFSIALPIATYYLAYDNYNYNAEIRMYRALDENDFDRILNIAADAPGPMTRQMVLSKNIALMHKGLWGNYMFKYDNSGEPPYTYDSLNVHMVHTAGAQIYYQHGKANFACRWAIENGVEYGFDVNDLKMLTRCAMISGEKKVAMKYLQILNNTLFHKTWARERMDELENPTLYHQTAEYKNIMPLRCYKNTLDGDEGLVEMYLINYFSHMNLKEPKFQETSLAYSLIQKDIALFWPKFFAYATLHEQEQMPIHYQEAAYLYGNLERTVDVSRMPFDQERIIKRYNEFQSMTRSMMAQGMTTEQAGEACKPIFGDTFWWFYFFCRNIKSY